MKSLFTGFIISMLIVNCTLALEVTPTEDGELLVNTILEPGIQIVDDIESPEEPISYQGGATAAGTFTGGLLSGLGMDAGIILSTGDVSLASGPNEQPDTTGSDEYQGATSLEFEFETETGELYCRYVFASEEYDELIESGYADVLKLFLDGKNIALLPGTGTPVSTNTINAQSNPEYFNDNSSGTFQVEYDGFTRVLTAVASDLTPGPHHFKMVIMNVKDAARDSAVFLEAGTFSSLPAIVADNVTVDENARTMTFTVSLPKESTNLVNFSYTTHDISAIGESDYAAVSGTSAITPGSRSAEITVAIIDDLLNELDETFSVELSEPINAILASAQGIGTIADNDEFPALAITDATAEEETQKMTFTISLSAPSSQDVSVEYSTVDDTAMADEDYTATQGTLTILAGESSGNIDVDITLDEARKEGDEIFFVALSNPENAVLENEQGKGTIQNTPGGFFNRMLGRPIPEPSTIVLLILGLFGIGWVARCRRR